MTRERPRWKEPVLWMLAFLVVTGSGMAIEAKAFSTLVDDRAIAGLLGPLRSRVQTPVLDFFGGLVTSEETQELEWLEQAYGIGVPDIGQQAARLFDSGWRTITQTTTRAAAVIKAMLNSVATIGIVAAVVGLLAVAALGGWLALGEQASAALLANGAMCLLAYFAVSAALGKAAPTTTAEAMLAASNWVGGFLGFQLAVGVPCLILGAAGTTLLYFLAPKPPTGGRPAPTSRTSPGPRV